MSNQRAICTKTRRKIKRRLLAARPNCAYCGMRLTQRTATLDHVVPVAKGGAVYAPSNLVLACELCNRRKSDAHPYRPPSKAPPA